MKTKTQVPKKQEGLPTPQIRNGKGRKNENLEIKLGLEPIHGYKKKLTPLEQGRLNTKLINAAKKGSMEHVLDLLRAGADVHAKDDGGMNALIYASCYGHLDTIELLLLEGADAGAKSKSKGTALIYACKNDQMDAARLLLSQKKIDVDAVDDFGDAALSWAVTNKNLALAGLLLDNGANPDTIDGTFKWPLMITTVVMKDSTNMLKLLLDKEANANARDRQGRTALTFAKKLKRFGAAKILRERGAVDVRARTEISIPPTHIETTAEEMKKPLPKLVHFLFYQEMDRIDRENEQAFERMMARLYLAFVKSEELLKRFFKATARIMKRIWGSTKYGANKVRSRTSPAIKHGLVLVDSAFSDMPNRNIIKDMAVYLYGILKSRKKNKN